ncbi:MAG TPA: hypothetical protein VGH73_00815 [Thermoanaerobaculia bacterium]|jgi:hypothetical protein
MTTMKREEHALYGVDPSGRMVFWSFTSDGRHSEGTLTDGGGVHWAAESREPTGWSRFVNHHYTALER